MDIVGKWRIAASLTMNDQFEEAWKTVEEMSADPDVDPFDLQMYSSLVVIGEDGIIRMVVPVPDDVTKEEIDAAVEAGECELYAPGLLTMDKKSWKEVDGKYFFDSGIEGDILGEETDPWVEITPTDNGIQYATFRLVRAE